MRHGYRNLRRQWGLKRTRVKKRFLNPVACPGWTKTRWSSSSRLHLSLPDLTLRRKELKLSRSKMALLRSRRKETQKRNWKWTVTRRGAKMASTSSLKARWLFEITTMGTSLKRSTKGTTLGKRNHSRWSDTPSTERLWPIRMMSSAGSSPREKSGRYLYLSSSGWRRWHRRGGIY